MLKRRNIRFYLGFALCLFFLFSSTAKAQFSDTDIDFFEAKIRPILADHCYECHSPKSDHMEGGLNITTRAGIISGGDTGPAIIVGNAEESLLIQSVKYSGIYEMPPSSKLPDDQIRLLEDWITRGAPWPDHEDTETGQDSKFDLAQRRADHWCWQPYRSPDMPTIENSNWPLDPIDKFILKKLETNELVPAEDCDRRTWIRRVYFDLTGLPPEPEAIEKFLHDEPDEAFSNVVDELLASPHFGERWARHWMDLVRYAETYGHEYDYPIAHAFQYRDYLIRAFNQDVPYDQFVQEHVAGDLIEKPRINPERGFNESIMGTGFWFLGEATHAPVDVKADEAGRIDNQIDVLTKTFLGLTVACARCHDHKFDAISAKDYYALSGYMQSSRRQVALLDPGQQIEKNAISAIELKKKGNVEAQKFVRQLKRIDADKWKDIFESSIAATKPENAKIIRFSKIADQKELEDESHPFHFLYWLKHEMPLMELQIRKLEAAWNKQQQAYDRFIDSSQLYADFSHGIPNDWFAPKHIASSKSNRFIEFSATGSLINPPSRYSSGSFGGKFQNVLRSPTFELTHDVIALRIRGRSSKVRLIIDGFEMDIHNPLLFNGCHLDIVNKDKFQWLTLATDVKNYRGHRAYMEFLDYDDGYIQLDEIRFLNSDDPKPVEPPGQLAKLIFDQQPSNMDEYLKACSVAMKKFLSGNNETYEYFDLVSLLAENSAFSSDLFQCRNQIFELEKELPHPLKAIAIVDGSCEDEYLFIRGNTKTPGEIVPRRFLTAISQADDVTQNFGSGRLNLAAKITDDDNPLTYRVIVNRIWHHLMGNGIVKSVDNFGVLGETPTHPELLNYLSVEFKNNGKSIKSMIRRIVLTRSYRMSSQPIPSASEIDPDNRLFHRANIKRLPGESIRDSILAVSGNLNKKMFGPGVPVHLTEFMQGRGRPRKSGEIDGEGRRSIYLEIRRNFLMPMMLAFDTPIPFNTIGRRHQSNVPAQALILMNDPFVVQQATKWSENLLSEFDKPGQRISEAFLQALGRPPSDKELARSREFLRSQAVQHGLDNDTVYMNNKLVWKDFCHAFFNMKEFIYIK